VLYILGGGHKITKGRCWGTKRVFSHKRERRGFGWGQTPLFFVGGTILGRGGTKHIFEEKGPTKDAGGTFRRLFFPS